MQGKDGKDERRRKLDEACQRWKMSVLGKEGRTWIEKEKGATRKKKVMKGKQEWERRMR